MSAVLLESIIFEIGKEYSSRMAAETEVVTATEVS